MCPQSAERNHPRLNLVGGGEEAGWRRVAEIQRQMVRRVQPDKRLNQPQGIMLGSGDARRGRPAGINGDAHQPCRLRRWPMPNLWLGLRLGRRERGFRAVTASSQMM